jgi:Asp-tRNA(Asn)/Glu-tRNA(Gln) amidotransferase A subunit family amidase
MTFQVEEATISDIHAAYQSGALSCADLVSRYLARIEAYDRNGPALNSIITVNPQAAEEAAALDDAFAKTGGLTGPLHGIPVVVKDQVETAGIMTTFGSIAADGYMPERDATVIKRLREAGAIILAKTAMPDFATSWFAYCSMLGATRNPYDLDRDPGGSSGGTGCAVAANLGAIGVGEDTGGSIRVPASFDNLVGLKVTPGLISRNGMSPLVIFQDSAGPMCRTVTDLAKLLEVLVGFDPEDPYTTAAVIAGPPNYVERLDKAALSGKTIGVVRSAFGPPADRDAASVNAVMEAAIGALVSAGAEIVDVEIPDLAHYVEYTSLYINHSLSAIDGFLASRPTLQIGSLKELHEAKKYHPLLDLFEAIVEGPEDPYSDPEYYPRYTARETFQRIVIGEMAKAGADALVYPTTQIPSPTRKELDAGRWTTFTYPTNTLIASQTWMPALSVPAGFTDGGVPVGMEMVGLPYHEGDLLSLAYAFEQATKHRRAPSSTPELPG